MNRRHSTFTGAALIVAAIALSPAVRADFEVTAPDGRRIAIKDDGTWRNLDAKDKPAADDGAKDAGEAELHLQRKADGGGGCRLTLRLVNNFPYEIRTIVPTFRAYRANGVIYDSTSTNFNALRPGDSLNREVLFQGISCQDIARVQVVGGDRCDMGDLDKFMLQEGRCLARVRVVSSDLVRFDK